MPLDDPDSLSVGLHTFVDESYGEDHYYVGAIVVTTAELTELERRLENFMILAAAKFGIDPATELHGHEIMQGRDSWACTSGQVHEAVWVCRNVIHIIVNAGARIHLQGVDVRRLNARYKYPDSPYRISLRHLLQRVQTDECEYRGLRTTVTADILDESDAATAAIAGFVRRPTPGFRPTRLSHIEPVRYVDSSTSRGIQAADIVTYMLRRHLEMREAHPRAIKAARQLYNAAAPNIRSCRKWKP